MAQKKLGRARVRASVRRQVALFYEGDVNARLHCVVSGQDVEVELHHLSENPAESEDPRNLIPLHSALNKNLDKRQSRIVDERITREGLAGRSAQHYSRGRYSHGYGCSVLGAALATNVPRGASKPDRYYIDADNAVHFAANALINLRPINQVEYATNVLVRFVNPILETLGHEIERSTLARVAMEIGSYFRDAGDGVMALRVAQLARSILANEPLSGKVKVLLARLWQHEGISKFVQHDSAGAQECFKRSEEYLTAAYSIGQANQVLYEAQLLLRLERPPFDEISSLLRLYPAGSDPHVLTNWTDLELRLTEAQMDYQEGGTRARARAFARVRDALRRIGRDATVPTRAIFAPVLQGFADEYQSHVLEVVALTRTLPTSFGRAAAVAVSRLQQLAHRDSTLNL
jgi:hypothetical protein